jgi:putative chitinase
VGNPNAFELSDLAALVGPNLAAVYWPHLILGFHVYSLSNQRRQAMFLAECCAETGGFRQVVEDLYYTDPGRLMDVFPSKFPTVESARAYVGQPERLANLVYGTKNGNRGPASGDGWFYRGRGLIQITGLGNVLAVQQSLARRFSGVPDFRTRPELLEQPKWAALSACDFWARRTWAGLSLNRWADLGNLEIVTRAINGGLTGLPERRAWYARALRALS